MRGMGELMTAALRCTTKEEAQRLVREEVRSYLQTWEGVTEEDARKNVLTSIGYITGDGMTLEERTRVLNLFETKHPYFGSIEEWPKTSEEIFKMGYALGKKLREDAQ